jgi:hypothetical protein
LNITITSRKPLDLFVQVCAFSETASHENILPLVNFVALQGIQQQENQPKLGTLSPSFLSPQLDSTVD